MVSRKLLVFALAIVVGHCHGQVATTKELKLQNEITSFGERLESTTTSAPSSATIAEDINTELNRTTSQGQFNETQVDNNKKASLSEPLEGHSSDLLASIFGEPSELEISGLHLPASEASGSQDDSALAMASTGQARGNRFLMPSESQSGAKSRLMLKQQQLLAALDPLGAGDPYFMDSVSSSVGPSSRSSSSVQGQTKRRIGQRYEQQAKLVKRRSGQQHAQPATSNREESEDESEDEVEYRKEAKFAEGDDIFKDDKELEAPRQKSASVQRPAQHSMSTDESSSEANSEDDDDDDAANEQEEAGSDAAGSRLPVLGNKVASLLARSGSSSSLGRSSSNINNKKQVARFNDGSRRPLKGIEDSALSVQDERLDATNVKASKRKPEVELVLRSYQQQHHDDRPVAAEGKKQLELEAEEVVTSADSQQLVEKSGTNDLQAAAGHHHGHHGHHYYQYAGVPKKKAWKMGFKRGNHKHEISRHEKGYKNKFHSSFKWHAKEKCKKKKKCHSTGKMTWHYEHHEKKKKHHY